MDAKFSEVDCTIGLSESKTHAVITVPIRKYALDYNNCNALIFGKLRELEIHLLNMAEHIRRSQKQNGVITLDAVVPPSDLKKN